MSVPLYKPLSFFYWIFIGKLKLHEQIVVQIGLQNLCVNSVTFEFINNIFDICKMYVFEDNAVVGKCAYVKIAELSTYGNVWIGGCEFMRVHC